MFLCDFASGIIEQRGDDESSGQLRMLHKARGIFINRNYWIFIYIYLYIDFGGSLVNIGFQTH